MYCCFPFHSSRHIFSLPTCSLCSDMFSFWNYTSFLWMWILYFLLELWGLYHQSINRLGWEEWIHWWCCSVFPVPFLRSIHLEDSYPLQSGIVCLIVNMSRFFLFAFSPSPIPTTQLLTILSGNFPFTRMVMSSVYFRPCDDTSLRSALAYRPSFR